MYSLTLGSISSLTTCPQVGQRRGSTFAIPGRCFFKTPTLSFLTGHILCEPGEVQTGPGQGDTTRHCVMSHFGWFPTSLWSHVDANVRFGEVLTSPLFHVNCY